jgi:tetratricopeptide (TPR) repeat protein
MLTLLLLLLQTPSPDIVVVGPRLAEEQAACRGGGCTPGRDAQVSIAYAEAQFRAGRYLDARDTLAAAVARQRRRGSEAPRAVAALYEAYATVALHEGDQEIYQRAVAGRVRTLRDNLPAGDPAVVAAAPALGDMWVKLRHYQQADTSYRAAERAAIAAGQERAALFAAIKRVGLAAAMGQPGRASRMLDEIAARPAAQEPALRSLVEVVRFRIAARDADDATMMALARRIGGQQQAAPPLLWEPPFPTDAVAAGNAQARRFSQADVFTTRSGDYDGVQWIDVGFWIRPDGRTADAEILRGSPSPEWGESILRRIDARVYAATDGIARDTTIPAAGGIYRVERVTGRSTYVTPAGSLIRRRVAADGFETLDLTRPQDTPR